MGSSILKWLERNDINEIRRYSSEREVYVWGAYGIGIDVANYLEDCKDRYDNTFRQEEIKNKDLIYNEKNYE